MSNTFANYPAKYLLFNSQTTKNLAIVMEIEGVSTLYGIADTFTTVRYGDPGVVYGLPGLVYGGLRKLDGVKPYMILDGSMTIGQKIEPESGKGNIGTLTITLIDFNGEISQLITPGIVVDEILFSKQVKIYLGFTQTSFPQDYLIVYQGYFTSVDCPPGVVKFQISDTTTKVRQPICNMPMTNTTASIDSSTLAIPVLNTDGFYQQILGPDNTFDPTVGTFIRIEDEVMPYGPTGLAFEQFNVDSRGALGSAAVPHDIDTEVDNSIQFGIGPGINVIELALKIYLSGWGGPCETGILLGTFVYVPTTTPFFDDSVFTLIAQDGIRDLGLSIGDYFTVSGASNSGNNISGRITGFGDTSTTLNSVIFTDQTFILENPTTAVVALRSQYDTLPVDAGLKMRMRDVDVATFLYIKKTYFTSAGTSNVRLYVDAAIQAKDLITSELFLPFGLYGISRFGRISLSITKPPLPGVGKLVQIDWTSVLGPDKIHVTRSTNNRSFYNLVSYEFDFDPIAGTFGAIQYFLDTTSLNQFGDQVSQLPVQSKGLHSDLGGALVAQNRGTALLTRYKKCTIIIEITVNWTVGSLIEVSDIILLVDNGQLQIMNFETGVRNLGSQLYEVIDRQYNIMAGNVKLQLMGGLGFNVDSRFALYSPSSVIGVGSTSVNLVLTPSFGQTNIANELAKWTPLINLPIQVHSPDWSVVATTVIVGTGITDAMSIQVFPALPFSPTAGFVIDIAPYPTDTNKLTDSLLKTLYAHLTPTVAVTAGISDKVFTVDISDVSKFTLGNTVIVRSPDFAFTSPPVVVSDITGNQITVAKTLGFTPDSTYFVDGIGFHDGTNYYRYG